jgi:hypothetical protein
MNYIHLFIYLSIYLFSILWSSQEIHFYITDDFRIISVYCYEIHYLEIPGKLLEAKFNC